MAIYPIRDCRKADTEKGGISGLGKQVLAELRRANDFFGDFFLSKHAIEHVFKGRFENHGRHYHQIDF